MSSAFRHRISLILNCILATAALMLILHRPIPTPVIATEAITPAAVETPVFTKQPKRPHYMENLSASDQRRWLVDQLRAMGVPNNVLARIVLADLDAKWTRHAGEVTKKCHGDPKTMAALQMEIDLSLDSEMRAALGEEGFKQWDYQNMLREANRGKIQLTASETDSSYVAWKKLQQRELELKQARINGEMDNADINDAHEKAVAEFDKEMKTLLGDDRYANSQKTGEDIATANLQEIVKAKPGDTRFQDLLKTQEQWNEQRLALDKQFQNDPLSSAYADEIKALDAARDQEYQRVLGADAFDALKKEQDPGYTQMKKFENLWGLDDNSVESVYRTLKYYQKTAEDYQAQARQLEARGQAVDWDAMNKNLQQFAEQTQQSLQNYLGRDRFDRMQQNGAFQMYPPELTEHSKPSQQ